MKRFSLLVIVWGLIVPAYIACSGASVGMSDLPYFCGFEDDGENSEWKMNVNAPTANVWNVGAYDAYDGNKSLYVSSDGQNAVYDATAANIVLAYRELTLEQGSYDFAFDWKGIGKGSDGYVRVMLTQQKESDLVCRSGSVEPAFLNNNKSVSLMGEYTYLYGEADWKHVQTRFSISATWENAVHTSRKLFLLVEWLNTTKNNEQPQTVLLDNIQLSKTPASPIPHNPHVDYQKGYSNVYWDGFECDRYQVRYRRLLDGGSVSTWREKEFETLVFTEWNMDFGAYEFWLRGMSEQNADGKRDTTIYYYLKPLYVYQTDCFDALNMYGAAFETGVWSASNGKTISGNERVDLGYASENSRHTTHYMQDERDERTIGTRDANGNPISLRTVPEGAFGSVRLGNWLTGSQYESITFTYTVPSSLGSILLIQYAMVLQETGDHPEKDQPRLTIDVLDSKGTPIDVRCGMVDFHTPTKAEKADDPEYMSLWYENKTQGNWWQDWRAVGLNLDEWVDSTLTIVITSYDCDQGGHFGYCYFTLSCISSEMDGIPWGEESSTNLFSAPLGFNYVWYKEGEEDVVLSTENTFAVDENDPANYFCRVIYPSNSECNYVMEATARPHTPKAEIQWDWVPENCENAIMVRNASHVQLHNQVTGEIEDRYDMQLTDALWTLPDGTETTELNYGGWYMKVPNEGKQLVYSLRASNWVKGEEYADSVVQFVIDVPAIDSVHTYLQDTMLCEMQDGSQHYTWAGKEYVGMDAGLYQMTDTLLTWTGCDSIVHRQFQVTAVRDTVVYDTICAGGSYDFGGIRLTKAGNDYVATFTSFQTGCDSVVHLHLWQLPEFKVTVNTVLICADGDVTLSVENSEYADAFEVRINEQEWEFDGREVSAQLQIPLNGITAGENQAEVAILTPWCEPIETHIPMLVNLPKDVVKAKWNDVLAVKNELYNGGYRFRSFQWYRNGDRIEGATGSWIHADDLSEAENEYYVEVVLENGTPLIICPFSFASVVPDRGELQTSKARKVLDNQHIYIEVDDVRYDIYGRKAGKK